MSLNTITHAVVAALAGLLVWQFRSRAPGGRAGRRAIAGQPVPRASHHRARRPANARVAQAGQQVATAYQGALNDAIETQATLQAAATRAGR